jgi:hypothetical protein
VNEVIKQIKFDTYRIEHELIGLEIINASMNSFPLSTNVNKYECSFMYSQLLKDVFLNFKITIHQNMVTLFHLHQQLIQLCSINDKT